MKVVGLSDQCVQKLLWQVEEGDADEFISYAGACVLQVRDLDKYEPRHKAAAQKRINKVKKAFDALTDQDRLFLDIRIDEDNPNPAPSCENMMMALRCPVPSMRMSLPRLALINFARWAVLNGWIDVSKDNSVLTQVIKIIMEEAGVKHDAVEIASEAVKTL
jgi:hypothetical protein